jgi:hypothetical protein
MRPLLLASALVAQAAFANPYLNQAKAFQQQLDFEKCLRRLEQASRWQGNTKAQLAQIELYGGLCEAGLGHETEALEHFELGFTLDPKLELPPQQGPKITRIFNKAKEKAPPPEETVEAKPAPPPTPEPKKVEVEPPPPSPPPAVVIEPAKTTHLAPPLIIGAVGLAAVGVGVAFGVLSKSAADNAHSMPMTAFESDIRSQLASAQTDALIANVLFGVAGAALIAAIATYFGLN